MTAGGGRQLRSRDRIFLCRSAPAAHGRYELQAGGLAEGVDGRRAANMWRLPRVMPPPDRRRSVTLVKASADHRAKRLATRSVLTAADQDDRSIPNTQARGLSARYRERKRSVKDHFLPTAGNAARAPLTPPLPEALRGLSTRRQHRSSTSAAVWRQSPLGDGLSRAPQDRSERANSRLVRISTSRIGRCEGKKTWASSSPAAQGRCPNGSSIPPAAAPAGRDVKDRRTQASAG